MKRRLIAGAAMLVVTSCSTLPVPERDSWDIRTFGSEMDEYATCMALQDSSTMWAGGFEVAADYSHAVLLRLTEGNIEVSSRLDRNLNARLFGIQCSPQNIVLAGFKRRGGEILNDRDPLLACFDYAGNPAWVFTNDSTEDESYWCSVTGDNGETIAFGQRRRLDGTACLPLIGKHSRNGELTSSRTYDIATQAGFIAALSTGSEYVTAITALLTASESSSVDREAVCLATVAVQTDSLTVFRLSDGTAKCIAQMNGNILVGGIIRHTGATKLICTDAAGNQRWTVEYGERLSEFSYEITSVISDNGDSAFVIAGNARGRTGFGYNIFIAKFAEDGALCWDRTYTASNEVKALGIVRLHSGEGYAVCGSIDVSGRGNHDVYLLKVDSDGYINRPAEPFPFCVP